MNLTTSIYETTEAPKPPAANARPAGKNRWRIPNSSTTLQPQTPCGWINGYVASPEPFALIRHPEPPQMARENRSIGGFSIGIPNLQPGEEFTVCNDTEYHEFRLDATGEPPVMTLTKADHGNLLPIPVLT
jgi:hypothetical protein